MTPDRGHDVIVIGAGPAGVSCALECFDIQLDTLVIEAAPTPGGQLFEIPHSIRNVAAGRFEDGPALQRALHESAGILGEQVRLSRQVTGLDLDNRWIEVDGQRLSFRALVIATGTSRQELPAAPDGAFGGDITYQLESDPQRFAGSPVAVIGGGDSGTLDALALARDSTSVTLVHRSQSLTARDDILEQVRANARIEDLPGWELEALKGSDRLEEVVLTRRETGERRSIEVRGLVVKIARVPNTGVLEGQLQLDHSGGVVVDRDLHTSHAGVFAAGDVISGAYARIAAALGQGSLAARSALRYLEARS
jgi:thioredoxin reductase (NADPH)